MFQKARPRRASHQPSYCCPCCGAELLHSGHGLMLRCPVCGFPVNRIPQSEFFPPDSRI